MKGRTKAMQVRAEVVSMSIRCTCKGEMTKWGEWTQCEKGVGVTTGKSSWDEIPRHHAFNWHLTTICGPLKKKNLSIPLNLKEKFKLPSSSFKSIWQDFTGAEQQDCTLRTHSTTTWQVHRFLPKIFIKFYHQVQFYTPHTRRQQRNRK